MSRIDDMVAEQCPDGVTFRSIGEVATCTAGATPSKSVAAYWENGTIPWLSSGEVNKGTIYHADTLISRAGFDFLQHKDDSSRCCRHGAGWTREDARNGRADQTRVLH